MRGLTIWQRAEWQLIMHVELFYPLLSYSSKTPHYIYFFVLLEEIIPLKFRKIKIF